MSTDPSKHGRTIHIGNLSSHITEEQLIAFFSQCGTITNVRLAGDPSYPSRFGFIEFADQTQAIAACQLTGTDLGGKILKISLSKSPISQPYNPNKLRMLQHTHYTRTPMYPTQYMYHHPSTMIRPQHTFSYFPPQYTDQQQDFTTGGNKTIYVAGLDSQLTEQQLQQFFSFCGVITNYKICGDPEQPTRFAFVEFATAEAAVTALTLSGSVLGKSALRIFPSKTSIQQQAPHYNLTSSQKEAVERTIHIGGVDVNLTEDYIRDFFTKTCGPINKVVLAGDAKDSHQTRFAFIEFQTKESAKEALKLTGTNLGGREIRVSQSRSPILSGSGSKSSSSQQTTTHDFYRHMYQNPYGGYYGYAYYGAYPYDPYARYDYYQYAPPPPIKKNYKKSKLHEKNIPQKKDEQIGNGQSKQSTQPITLQNSQTTPQLTIHQSTQQFTTPQSQLSEQTNSQLTTQSTEPNPQQSSNEQPKSSEDLQKPDKSTNTPNILEQQQSTEYKSEENSPDLNEKRKRDEETESPAKRLKVE